MICWDPASITFHLIYREGGGREAGEWWRNNGADSEESVSSVETKLTVIYLLFRRDNIHFISTNNSQAGRWLYGESGHLSVVQLTGLDLFFILLPSLSLSLSLSLVWKYYLSRNDSSAGMWSDVESGMVYECKHDGGSKNPGKGETFLCHERSLVEMSSWAEF